MKNDTTVPTKGQGDEAQHRRLSECRCPVHGHGMTQVASATDEFGEYTEHGGPYDVVACPRKACRVRVVVNLKRPGFYRVLTM